MSYEVYSVVINEKFTPTDRARWKACRAVSRNYDAIAYRHSHHKESLGGRKAPHIHLVLAVPKARAERWEQGVLSDLTKFDYKEAFMLSNPDVWVRNPDNLIGLLRYLAGSYRTHLPEFVYASKHWFQIEQELTGSLSLHTNIHAPDTTHLASSRMTS
jgi:hypothetical protein